MAQQQVLYTATHNPAWRRWSTGETFDLRRDCTLRHPHDDESEDPLPLDADDAIAAAAGHLSAPSPIFSPLFVAALGCAAFSCYSAVRQCGAAWVNRRRVRDQLSDLEAREEAFCRDAQRAADGQWRDNEKEFIKNIRAEAKTKRQAVFGESARIFKSALLAVGTAVQSVGILLNGALLGRFVGTVSLSPVLLGAGLLGVAAYSALSAGQSMADLARTWRHRLYSGIDGLAGMADAARAPLERRLQRKRWVACLGIAADAAMAVGAAIVSLSLLGVAATPHGLMLAAVGLIVAGVVAVIAHHIAHRRLVEFHNTLGVRIELQGEEAHIARRIAHARNLQSDLDSLEKTEVSDHESGLRGLVAFMDAEAARDRETFDEPSLQSVSATPTDELSPLLRLASFLSVRGLLDRTVRRTVNDRAWLRASGAQAKQTIFFSLPELFDGGTNAETPTAESLSGSQGARAFREAFVRAARKELLSSYRELRRSEERQLLDHLYERRVMQRSADLARSGI